MNRFRYRAYYRFVPSLSPPFQSEKSGRKIAEALSRFPIELEQYIDGESTVEVPNPQPEANASQVVVTTEADKQTIDEAVKKCLTGLGLCGDSL